MLNNGFKVGRRRFFILFLIVTCTVLNYSDRSILSMSGSAMMSDLSISPAELGIIFSGFAWAYVIGQLPGGFLLDRYGAKIILTFAIILWSSVTLLQGFVGWAGFMGTSAVIALFVLRFLLGGVEAPSFPADSRIVSCWFPTSERGTASSIFNSSQYMSGVIFTPILGWLIHSLGWEYAFILMGGAGIVFGIYWYSAYHEPHSDKYLSSQEMDYIRSGGALVDMEANRKEKKPVITLTDIRKLFMVRNMWALFIGHYCINSLTYFVITWFPVYLVKSRGMTIIEAGWVTALPAVCGFLGGIIGGVFSDFLISRGMHPSTARKIPFATGMLLSTALVVSNFVDSNIIIVGLMALAFLGKGFAAIGWATFSDVAPAKMIGVAGSIFNGIGNTAGIITPIVIGIVVSTTQSFDMALWFLALHGLVGFLSYTVLAGTFTRIKID